MKKILFLILIIFISVYSYSQPRFLDSTFGDGGKVVTNFGSEEGINSIVLQSDKKIIAAGYYDLIKKNISFNYLACALARYQTNGNLDSSFGVNGFIYFDGRYSKITGIVAQQNDKITGVGDADAYGGQRQELVVLQWKPNGELDSSFSGDGITSYGSSPYTSLGTAMALQHDSKILATGIQSTFNSWDSIFIIVTRLNKNGTFDSGFNKNGKKKIAPGFHSYATGIIVNSKGEIVISGYNISESGFSQAVLIGLTPNGDLNKNFGNGGIASVKLSDDASFAALTLTKDEKIIAGGSKGSQDSSNFFLVQFDQHGIIDSSFGVNGIINNNLGFSDNVTSIAIQTDEKIIAAGNSFDATKNETYFALSRYYSNGKPDISFGAKGKIFTAFSGHTNLLKQILLDTNNKIVAGGSTNIRRYGYGDFALSRYLNDSSNNIKPEIPIASKSYYKQDLKLASAMK